MPLDQQDIIARFQQAIAAHAASQSCPQGPLEERKRTAVEAYMMRSKFGPRPEDELLSPLQMEEVLTPALPPEHRLGLMTYLGLYGDMGAWIVIDHTVRRDAPLHLLVSCWGDIFVPGVPPAADAPPTALPLYNVLMHLKEEHQKSEELGILQLKIRDEIPRVRKMLLARCLRQIDESANTPQDA